MKLPELTLVVSGASPRRWRGLFNPTPPHPRAHARGIRRGLNKKSPLIRRHALEFFNLSQSTNHLFDFFRTSPSSQLAGNELLSLSALFHWKDYWKKWQSPPLVFLTKLLINPFLKHINHFFLSLCKRGEYFRLLYYHLLFSLLPRTETNITHMREEVNKG